MKVCVLMWYDGAIADYADSNFAINKEYCLKHGLALLCSGDRACPGRHPAWERLPLILKVLPSYDWVVWVDADAHFYRDAPDIKEMLSGHPDKDMIFSGDKPPRGNINTGIFAVKRTEFSRMFVERWLKDEEAYSANRFPGWWEQGVLIDMWERNVEGVRDRCAMLEYGKLQHFYPGDRGGDAPLVFHMAEQELEARVAHSKDYLGEN